MSTARLRLATGVTLLMLATACAGTPAGVGVTTPPAGISGNVVRVEEARPSILEFRYIQAEDIWAVLPNAFRALGITGGVMDPTDRVFGNPQIRATTLAGQQTRNMFRCTNEGSGPGSVTQYRVEFGIAAQPRAVEEGGSELIVRIQAVGRLTDSSRSGVIHCVSNGTIERRLKQQVELEVARRMKGAE